MDRRVLLFAILLPLLGISGQGQIIKDYSDAELEVYYNKHLEKDTAQMGTQVQDTKMSLRIGGGYALFAATRNMWVDSLDVYNHEKYLELYFKLNPIGEPVWTPLASFEDEYLFKNMPDGKNTVYQGFGFNRYTYEEDIEPQKWILGDNVRSILGYECRLAECDYRGRHWIAWYAPEIAVSEGPWKLGGLPGLILEAYDTKRQYVFTALGMTTDVPGKVGIHIFTPLDISTIPREEYLRFQWRRMNSHEDPAEKLRAAGIIKSKKKQEEPVKMIYQHYDFEETDYPHVMDLEKK
ncbi:MAG: GLPGLI family protein [Porphyromonas sp.]|uniref:GLPGLI family protein n=1 Tax=Porphyromonas sp. TaxID=1924944 RepID=UPI002A91453F|nr:GLPGLI family protein [Porphyromonas sp.]MDD7469038.1 GLPGLI family protein [Bacteroidales bacterium]MDY6102528.1 GLPGLI family protein [Porphyromonas sp.]